MKLFNLISSCPVVRLDGNYLIMTCLNCTYFCVWDGDPVCTYNFHINLPKQPCETFCECSCKLGKLHEEIWNNTKQQFFNNNTVGKELKREYLKSFPNDKELL